MLVELNYVLPSKVGQLGPVIKTKTLSLLLNFFVKLPLRFM